MTLETYNGNLGHKNPTCPKCSNHCYTMYIGGNKERIAGFFICKNCNTVYQIPKKKRCEFKEVTA